MSAEAGEVWIGLRADGVEIMRVKATCVEISRSNGVAKCKTLGPVVFADLPCDVSSALLTTSESEHGSPFTYGPLEPWRTFRQDDTLQLADVTFERILDVPRYVKPPGEPKRRRIRLGSGGKV